MKKENLIYSFKEHWGTKYAFMYLNLSDKEIERFIKLCSNDYVRACNMAADYLLANDLTEVML